MQLNKFIPLVKIDEGTHTVWGLATAEIPDKTGEICDYEATKKSYQSWSREALEKTTAAGQEPSFGNVRLMHQLEVAGKVTKLEFRDDVKQVWLASQPANDEIWKLLKGGFLTGYSQGGDYLWKRRDGKYTRYAAKITEVSYVDNPALGDATFTYVKADGSMELRKFANKIQRAGTPAIKGVIMPELENTGALEHLQKAKEAIEAQHAATLEHLNKCVEFVSQAEEMQKSAAKAAADADKKKSKEADKAMADCDEAEKAKAKKAKEDDDDADDKKKAAKAEVSDLAKATQFDSVLKGMQDQFAEFMTNLSKTLEAPKAVSGAGRAVSKTEDNGGGAQKGQASGVVFKAQAAAGALKTSDEFEKAMQAAFASGTPLGAAV